MVFLDQIDRFRRRFGRANYNVNLLFFWQRFAWENYQVREMNCHQSWVAISGLGVRLEVFCTRELPGCSVTIVDCELANRRSALVLLADALINEIEEIFYAGAVEVENTPRSTKDYLGGEYPKLCV